MAGNTTIGNGCFLGLGAMVTNNLRIGNDCFIGAGSLVSKDLMDSQVVIRRSDDIHALDSSHFLKLIENRF